MLPILHCPQFLRGEPSDIWTDMISILNRTIIVMISSRLGHISLFMLEKLETLPQPQPRKTDNPPIGLTCIYGGIRSDC